MLFLCFCSIQRIFVHVTRIRKLQVVPILRQRFANIQEPWSPGTVLLTWQPSTITVHSTFLAWVSRKNTWAVVGSFLPQSIICGKYLCCIFLSLILTPFFCTFFLSKLKFVLSLLCENCVQWHPQLSDLCPGSAWPRVCSDPRTRIDHKTACCSSWCTLISKHH